jgi:hypothetical protein
MLAAAATAMEFGQMNNHAVIVRFKYGLRDLGQLDRYEEQLEEAVRTRNVGDYDGNEIAVDLSDGSLNMDGDDADRQFG